MRKTNKLIGTMKRLIILISIIASCTISFAQSVTLEIKNIRGQEGLLLVSVFENQEQFDDEIPAKTIKVDKSNISSGQTEVKLALKPGVYGITVLDDEDNSKDMTYRFGVYPLEGVGFSGYKLSGMTKPEFSDFDFSVNTENQKLVAEIKYF